MSIEDIARPEIRTLQAYVAAEQIGGMIRLNANESPESPWAHLDRAPLNRYPQVRPAALQRRMAELYGVDADCVLTTRGSTEAIDTLIRAFCRPYTDNAVVTPPTFDMYKVYADVQAVELLEVPLDADNDFAFDADAVIGAANDRSKLIFICSPNNPTGTSVGRSDILRVADARRGRSVIVVDEAYIEFAGRDSMIRDVFERDNLVVLRTLSKAFALAGARCGAMIGRPEAVVLMSRVLSPYSFSTLVTERVLDAMTDEGFREAEALVRRTVTERERVCAALIDCDCVVTVWPSDANFLFVRFRDVDVVRERLRTARILIREFASLPQFTGCARITIGTREENDRLIAALSGLECGS
ncbi:MAG: histidinol-phosphate transaminase [Woeseiaceae bacterium]|nr:histidinol-phosphate transaminase [Woeseiaceae bacterium]